MQAAELRDNQEQVKHAGPAGAEEVLPVVSFAHGSSRDTLRSDVQVFLLIVAGLLVLGYVAHRLLVAAENRGWIFYRNRPRIQFLGFLEELVQPSVEYVIEEEASEAIRADQAETGQPTG